MSKTYTNHKGIKAATPPATGQTMYKDTQCKGLYLRVYSTGRKAFIHRYWLNGKERLVKLDGLELDAKSTETETSRKLSQARARVAEQKEQAAGGIDPAIERDLKAHKINTMPTVAEFAGIYIHRYAKQEKKSWESDKRYLDVDVIPALGLLPMNKVERPHIVALLDRKQEAGALVARNRLIALLSKFFNFAIERGHIKENPARGVKRTKETSKERALSESEILFLWNQTDEGSSLAPVNRLALRMVLVTGQRPGEVAAMQESQLQGDVWTIENTKNGRTHLVPLSPMALEIIEQARPYSRNGLLFPNSKNEIMHSSTLPQCMNRLRWPDQPATPHDLRRTCITGISKLGFNRLVQDKVSNHIDSTIGGVYDRHDYMPEKRAALDSWGRKLEEMITGETSGNVVPIRRAG